MMSGKEKLKERMDRILNRIGHVQPDHWNLKLDDWEWNAGVCLYGIQKAAVATKDGRYESFMEAWFDRNAEKRKTGSVNTVIPANGALCLYKLRGERRYLDICSQYADWCLNKALRTSNGGLAHVWSEGGLEDYRNQLWIDSLFMAGIFMIRYGMWSHNEPLVRAGMEQFDIHIRCQFDPQARLFYHGYHCIDNKTLGEFWGRGNGWAAVSLVELLDELGSGSGEASSSAGANVSGWARGYREVFLKLMERAYRLRLDDGMLRTLPEEPEAYPELTATALFGYAALKGARLGILDERFREWGMQAVDASWTHSTEEGEVMLASGGTDCQEKAGYLRVPYAQTLYAYGIVLLLFSEAFEADHV
ncbi:MAG: hypothetical protein K0R57_2196 [Paenibacillaceae bacterium]|nr:hypothetical protein [Paenibacillaceae bacterium]